MNMKKTTLLAVAVILALTWSSCRKGSEKRTRGDAAIEFDTISHNFGDLPYKAEANFEFIFYNTGEAPLLVSHVKSTCGCTVPEWSKEPVKAGNKGRIRVTYDTHRTGVFSKSIYVYSNASNGVQRLMITGRVTPPQG